MQWKLGIVFAGLALAGVGCSGFDQATIESGDSFEAERQAITNGTVVAFEAENLTRTASAIGSKVTSEAAASGGKYVEFAGTAASGAWIEFTLANIEAGTYDLAFLYKSNTNRGIIQASVDGANQGSTCNQYASAAAHKVACSLGSKTLTAGTHKIRFTVTGKSASSSGYQMVVDRISLTYRGTCSASTAPTGISASNSSALCGGAGVTLSVTGGSLGTGAVWAWYTSNAFTNRIGTGASITVTPAATTTYYVRAESTCNVTAAASRSVSVVPAPSFATQPQNYTAPCNSSAWVSFTATPAAGTTVTYQWYFSYVGSTAANPVVSTDRFRVGGNTQTLQVAPQDSQYLWVVITDSCGRTATSNKALLTIPSPDSCLDCTVPPGASTAPTGISSASTSPICSGTSTTLTVTGGSLGTGASWVWYANSVQAANRIGSGTSITVAPSAATPYYVRAEGTCNTTAAVSRTVSLVSPPQIAQQPQSYSAPCNSTAWVNFYTGPTSGTSVRSVQWYAQYVAGGTSEFAIPSTARIFTGQTTLTLSAAPQDSVYVRCEITDACGAKVSSTRALLTVPDPATCP